jgi:hypothetical protein
MLLSDLNQISVQEACCLAPVGTTNRAELSGLERNSYSRVGW